MLLSILLTFLLDQLDGFIQRDGQRVGILGQGGVFTVMKDIGSKTACADNNFRTFVVADGTGKSEQFQCLVQRQRLHTLIRRQLGKLRLLMVLGGTNLHNRAEASNLDKDGFAALRVYA